MARTAWALLVAPIGVRFLLHRGRRPYMTRTRPYQLLTVQPGSALLACCWRARPCRRCLRLGVRGRGFRRGNGNAVQPPSIANHLEHEIEIDLLRPRRDVAGQMEHTALIESGHDCE